jgi:dTMP kinase
VRRSAPAARGLFVTFEGGEGVGKSTQIAMLDKALREQGVATLTTREPGGSPGAEAVRHVLLSGAAEPLGPQAEAMLFAAARADHVDTLIRPALEEGVTVLCDRFYDSTRVYQGDTGKVTREFLAQLEKVSVGDCRPDLTIILDLDPKEGMRRAAVRRDQAGFPDRFEKEALEMQDRRRLAYLQIAREEPKRCRVVDASGDAVSVHNRVLDIVLAAMEARKRTAHSKKV